MLTSGIQDLDQIHGIIGLSVSLAADLFISTSLCYYLYKSRTGLRKYVGSMAYGAYETTLIASSTRIHDRSDDIIVKLIALTITTGMLTT